MKVNRIILTAIPQEIDYEFLSKYGVVYFVGIGILRASVKTRKVLYALRQCFGNEWLSQTEVINVGSAGSHTLPVNYVAECNSFVYRGFPQIPIPFGFDNSHPKIDWMRTPGIERGGEGLFTCSSGDSIVTKNNIDESAGAQVFDMEAYAIAEAVADYGIENFHALKYITDNPTFVDNDKDFFLEWQKALPNCKKALNQIFESRYGV